MARHMLLRKLCSVLALTALLLSLIVLPSSALGEKRTLVFIGDSKTVGMDQALTDDTDWDLNKTDEFGVWSARWGSMYDWFKATGLPQAEKSIGRNTSVLILMGFNDIFHGPMSRTDDYVALINKKAAKWKKRGADTYYVSVTPMGTSRTMDDFAEQDKLIRRWNRRMKNGLSEDVTYLDLYSQMMNNYRTIDTTHYDKPTYFRIYNLLVRRMNADHPDTHNSYAIPIYRFQDGKWAI